MIPLGILAQGGTVYTNWTRATAPATVPYISVAWAPLTAGNWFMFGNGSGGAATTNYYYSTNGTSWTTGTMPASATWGESATNGTTLVAYPRTGGGSIYTTTNGTTWTTRSISSPASTAFTLRFLDGRFLRGSQANLVWSTDTITWTSLTLSADDFDFGNGTHIALSAGGTSVRRCTGDPTVIGNWGTAISLPTVSGHRPTTIAFGNGIWVAGYTGTAGTTTYAYSMDNGLTWLTNSLPVSLGNSDSGLNSSTRIRSSDGAFYYAVGNAVYYSTDGLNWNTVSHGTGLTFNSRGFAANTTGQSIIVGTAGTVTGNVAVYLRGA